MVSVFYGFALRNIGVWWPVLTQKNLTWRNVSENLLTNPQNVHMILSLVILIFLSPAISGSTNLIFFNTFRSPNRTIATENMSDPQSYAICLVNQPICQTSHTPSITHQDSNNRPLPLTQMWSNASLNYSPAGSQGSLLEQLWSHYRSETSQLLTYKSLQMRSATPYGLWEGRRKLVLCI